MNKNKIIVNKKLILKKEANRMLQNVAPLKGGFMITSMVGFLISAIYVYNASPRWGFTFALFFALMFVASLISMTYGPDEAMLHVGQKKHFVSEVKK
ncbi:MAG: hypothetical protein AABX74_02040 [Nanoarchaeota archaeon]